MSCAGLFFFVCFFKIFLQGTHSMLMNILNKLRKKIRCDSLSSILSPFSNLFNKFIYRSTHTRIDILITLNLF